MVRDTVETLVVGEIAGGATDVADGLSDDVRRCRDERVADAFWNRF